WGIARDLATSSSFRPTGLALQMLNSAVGGAFYPVSASGPGAGGLNAAAFLRKGNWAVAITSGNASPITLSITLSAAGAPPTQAFELSAATPTTTNELANNVTIARAAITAPLRVTIPAYGFVILLPAAGRI
ncbi:MAG TPA: hypothetical protein VKS22_11630, partial [Candidatus Binataceae bacterium]|nr:hypothetical protein [Candidatus Binataceae bacterium]